MVRCEFRFFQLFPDDPVFQLSLAVFQFQQSVLGFWCKDALFDGFKDILHLFRDLPVFGLQRHQERFVGGVLFQ
ncbi:hypothetical protein [Faecalibaculum rodentium]|uniref:hypothetical protein n=1 Tax=Faecalibaculum rodentium TaxID=1702221 RepID=UPI0025A5AD56|nr:hypothetical protein [Faecalibaculum rodentium]